MRAFVLLFGFLYVFFMPAVVLASEAGAPRVMLAGSYAHDVDVRAYRVSEKLDGVRARWTGEALITRNGHRIDAPDWFTQGWPDVPLDGELWIARNRFDEVSAIVRASDAGDDAWRKVRFMVFDLPEHGGAFEQRVHAIRELLTRMNIAWLQPVEQFLVKDAAELDARFDAIVAAGGEGLMLHRRDARYRAGRSDDLLKYKPFEDAEARVVGYTRGEGKYAGKLGALIVEREDGARFRIGTGFSDAERAAPPPLGAIVTYRYTGFTANGLPRFARFLRVRADEPVVIKD